VAASARADHVADVQMSVETLHMSTSPVYVPAYVFRSDHLGAPLS
jgi:hypothetical protein